MLLVKAQERFKALTSEIPTIEKKLHDLQLELNTKLEILKTASEEHETMKGRLTTNQEKILGLGFRCLNKSLLTHVLSFLPDSSNECTTCKYWYSIKKKLNRLKSAV